MWHSFGSTQDCLLLHIHQQNVLFELCENSKTRFQIRDVHLLSVDSSLFYSSIISLSFSYSNNYWVLTTLDSLLQTQDEWKAICFEETSDCYVDLDEKTTWDNLRSCTVLVLLDNTSHLNLIVSSFVFVKIVWCHPVKRKQNTKWNLIVNVHRCCKANNQDA